MNRNSQNYAKAASCDRCLYFDQTICNDVSYVFISCFKNRNKFMIIKRKSKIHRQSAKKKEY